MDFACIVLFLAIYYLKPQEWTSIFAQIRFAQLTMIASLATLVFRERGLKLRDFFRTPHDWAIAFFFLWVCFTYNTGFVDGFKDFLNRLIFYVAIVHTLSTWNRISRFLCWWTAFVWITALLALAGEFFWDPLNSQQLTHYINKGRLSLRLSMVNNPNALGHTLAPVLAMLYFSAYWKRPVFAKVLGVVCIGIAAFAIYLTFSKGAFIVSAVVILATFTFGRPKWVQILVVAVFMASGIGALYALPRMNELSKSKTDEALQGRIKAFTHGYEYYTTYERGIGMRQFVGRMLKDHKIAKASHSTYVQTGAELGRIGMFLFLLVLWCNLRTVMFSKTDTPEQERIRRLLFILVVSYMASGWMVDFAYRATFFMFSAAVGAYHRQLYLQKKLEEERLEDEKTVVKPWLPNLAPAVSLPNTGTAAATLATLPESESEAAPIARRPWLRGKTLRQEPEGTTVERLHWSRIGVIDIVVVIALLKATEMAWTYAINHF